MNVFIAIGALALVLAVVFWRLFRTLMSPSGRGELDLDHIQTVTIATYRPLGRLLSEEDLRFLRSQPGYQPGMDRRLAAERRRVFRAYLRILSRDFRLLHRAARVLVLYAPQDEPDLAAALVRQSLCFHGAMAMVQLRLALHAVGIHSVRVDVRAVLDSATWMQAQIQRLAPQIAAA